MPSASPAGLCNPRLHTLPKNITFELRKDRQEPGHGVPGWRREIQCFTQGDKADPQLVKFLECDDQIRQGTPPSI